VTLSWPGQVIPGVNLDAVLEPIMLLDKYLLEMDTGHRLQGLAKGASAALDRRWSFLYAMFENP